MYQVGYYASEWIAPESDRRLPTSQGGQQLGAGNDPGAHRGSLDPALALAVEKR